MRLFEILVLLISALSWTNGHEHLNSTILARSEDATAIEPSSTASSRDELFPHRIVGGKRIRITKSPWTVAIIRNGRFWCGGSVIRPRWILSAAHCFEDGGKMVVRAGTRWFRSGGQTRSVDKIIMHGKYNSRIFVNDIALVKVKTKFQYTRFVRPIHLAKISRRLPRKYHVSGWGLMHEKHEVGSRWLRRIQLYPVRRSVCRKAYRGSNYITRKMICAEADSKGTCQGDSGGALVWKRRQYGIVSFGIGCAHPGYPGVYTDVRKYRSYIFAVMRNN